ncbi:transcriptional regulator [Pullulanibacillus camelliae]|uniref:Transcriptional regulator n=1 Tax=Pullulanibacillus camelliae TaxID=1707096 RepID=A0A8J2VLR7_9BACL|nr:BlaI/MecI/CopY family transcriptional regulator [Pullulanibacillus camelliae]GGE31137.1 transcriptional regulator [Pullulanibacillus camelliae]
MTIKNFKYDQVGLDRFFGPLEAKIMDYLWAKESEQSIKQVQQHLEKDKPINFNTVMTVMKRLVDKGILMKRTEGRLSLFRPVQSKKAFIDEQSKQLTETLLDEFGGVVINHMLDAMEDVDEDLLAKLEQKIHSLKKEH